MKFLQGNIQKFLLGIANALALCSCDNGNTASDISTAPEGTEWVDISLKDYSVQISGRYLFLDSNALLLSWSGSAITVGFEGSALKADLSSGPAVFDIFVDSTHYGRLDCSDYCLNSTFDIVSNLPYGNHFVTLHKSTEAVYGEATINKLSVFGKADESALPEISEAKIEFIGNSITCGFGVLDDIGTNEAKLVTESSYQSYAGKTSRLLGVESHYICVSGRGITVNCDGSTEGILPSIYDYASMQNGTIWNHSLWEPNIIVMNLGTNDFVSGKLDSAKFISGAIDFVSEIHSIHSNAKIFILDGPMLEGESAIQCRKYLDIVKDSLTHWGIPDIYRFSFDTQGALGYGAAMHPNQSQAEKDAQSLADFILSKNLL